MLYNFLSDLQQALHSVRICINRLSLFQRGREFEDQHHDVDSKDEGCQDPLVVTEPREDHEDETEAGQEDEGLEEEVEEEEADEDEAGEASQDHQLC